MDCRILLADDEPLVRSELRYILKQQVNTKVVGECTTGSQVIANVDALKPHILFLDINMPGMMGIEVARLLAEREDAPAIVFITAYEEYAVQAFKVDAAGYLLKPFSAVDVSLVLKKITKRFSQCIQSTMSAGKTQDESKPHGIVRVQGEKDGRMCLVDPEDICVVAVREKRTVILTKECEFLSNHPLMNLENKLQGEHFFRCHRNYLVNLKKVKEIIPWFNGSYLLVVIAKEKMEIPVSRHRIKEFKEIMDL